MGNVLYILISGFVVIWTVTTVDEWRVVELECMMRMVRMWNGQEMRVKEKVEEGK